MSAVGTRWRCEGTGVVLTVMADDYSAGSRPRRPLVAQT